MEDIRQDQQVPFRGFRGRRRKWLLAIAILLAAIALLYLLGPKPSKPDFSKLHLNQYSTDLHALEDSLNKAEASLPLKPDNEARIVWDTAYTRTPYSIVYLHGNGASQEEGDPIHEALAHRYGCNLFLARLSEHGIQSEEPMLDMDPLEWMQSALDAIAIGKAIGEKVIVVSCSTGSMLDLYLASAYPNLVEAHVMMSPNVDLFDPRSFILTEPWGLHIGRQITGSKYYGWKAPGPAQKYWYAKYRIEELTILKTIINETMNETTFSKINDPVIILYYYKDENNQDKVVSVKRMQEMFQQLGTPDDKKIEVALSDAGTHIISSSIFNSHLESIWKPVTSFLEEVVHLKPVNDDDWQKFLDQ